MSKQPVEDHRLVVLASSADLSDRRLYWSRHKRGHKGGNSIH